MQSNTAPSTGGATPYHVRGSSPLKDPQMHTHPTHDLRSPPSKRSRSYSPANTVTAQDGWAPPVDPSNASSIPIPLPYPYQASSPFPLPRQISEPPQRTISREDRGRYDSNRNRVKTRDYASEERQAPSADPRRSSSPKRARVVQVDHLQLPEPGSNSWPWKYSDSSFNLSPSPSSVPIITIEPPSDPESESEDSLPRLLASGRTVPKASLARRRAWYNGPI
ncbi:hypothetical protein JAAARDRAFT_42735, partial [Jaapia argillacea MUCL 33604]